uniref:GATA zinc finger domain-containing protein 14-like n=1 Tax=Dermatophagoides pteronyssinus TaxID=6956 RepID=A0A6P6Y7F0_DERPT|nr:GATA zinc finger domain-containing protein 14-like [Dermatophagoides pteronyssinus]
MNPSGSEFTLRVAICDLVERLKRMQHKCTYLEECRNQLVKEVIRLRLQNEWLSKQQQIADNTTTANIIHDNSSTTPEILSLTQNLQTTAESCFCNQSTITATNFTPNNNNHLVNDVHHCQNNNNGSQESNQQLQQQRLQTTKDDSIHLINILNELEHDGDGFENRQDSIRKLTIQMLKDLDNEMKTGHLKMELINFIRNNMDNSNDELIKFADNKNDDDGQSQSQEQSTQQSNDDYEAFNNNSDYYTNSHNLNIRNMDLIDNNNRQQQLITEQQRKDVKSGDEKISNNFSKSTMLKSKRQDSEHSNLKTAAAAATSTSTTTSIVFNSIDLCTKENQLITLITKIRNDIKYIHQGVLASTEKLKSKQLRHFFQKQINLDQQQQQSGMMTTTTTTKQRQQQ